VQGLVRPIARRCRESRRHRTRRRSHPRPSTIRSVGRRPTHPHDDRERHPKTHRATGHSGKIRLRRSKTPPSSPEVPLARGTRSLPAFAGGCGVPCARWPAGSYLRCVTGRSRVRPGRHHHVVCSRDEEQREHRLRSDVGQCRAAGRVYLRTHNLSVRGGVSRPALSSSFVPRVPGGIQRSPRRA
jgi:hypothetical protein